MSRSPGKRAARARQARRRSIGFGEAILGDPRERVALLELTEQRFGSAAGTGADLENTDFACGGKSIGSSDRRQAVVQGVDRVGVVEVVGPQGHAGAGEERLLAGQGAGQHPGESLAGGVEDGQRRRDRGIDLQTQSAQLGELRYRQLPGEPVGGRACRRIGRRTGRPFEMPGCGEAREQPVEGGGVLAREAARLQDGGRRRAAGELRLELQPLRDLDRPVGDVALDELAGLIEALGEQFAWNLAEQFVHRGVARRWQEGDQHRRHSSSRPADRCRPAALR